MKAHCTWRGKLAFSGEASGHTVTMDAKSPLGSDSGITPKQMLLLGVAGCAGMDVAALMRKHKQNLEAFDLHIEGELGTEHPKVFTGITLVFRLQGTLDIERVKESVHLSMTKYCGVSAMVSKVSPITYKIEVNGQAVGAGRADFGI